MTLDECNAALSAAGHREFIAKSRKGTYYFTGGNTLNWPETGIYDNVAPLNAEGKHEGYICWSPEHTHTPESVLTLHARLAAEAGSKYKSLDD